MELLLQTLLMVSILVVSVASDDLPAGNWGGQHISLEVTPTGGKLEFDCAHGEINSKIVLDKQRRFSVSGTYVEEHGGPVRQPDHPQSQPVLYIGQLTGNKMKLTVKRSDTKKVIGTFTLTRGQEAFIVKCR
ncbi:MAG: hypothetical protein SF097_22300 [Acidobacteriota bacterium]|nr:hypothetical protein [Acidobacteriota bacterium]